MVHGQGPHGVVRAGSQKGKLSLMKVFDDVIRTEMQPSGDAEPLFHFLNRIYGNYWDQVREVIECWFSRFPADARTDLHARIRNKNDDRNTHSALWELYLHEMLIGSGCEVKCHPDLPGRSRKPDFFAVKDEEPFYIEARRISAPDGEVFSGKRLGSIYDAINTMDSRNFFLQLTLNSEGTEAPSTRKLKAELAKWLQDLDPDEVITAYNGQRIEGLPDYSWEDRGWSIIFRAIPKNSAGRGRAGARAIGLYPFQTSFVDDVDPIRRALKDKGLAYGKLDRPYIVALATSSFSHDEDDMDRALYGTTQQSIGYASRGSQPAISRIPDGYWIGPKGWRHLGVSGILTVHNPAPWTWATAVPTLWENPNPDYPAPSLPTWRRASMNGWKVMFNEASSPPNSVLGIPSPWPTGDAFLRR